VRYGWDDQKRDSNLDKHGLDFVDAPEVFAGLTLTVKDDRFEYGEHRFVTLGMLKEIVVVVAHTETDEEIRVISMRKATRNEKEKYFQSLAN
jgi:uncharacterized DUF497 family protein